MTCSSSDTVLMEVSDQVPQQRSPPWNEKDDIEFADDHRGDRLRRFHCRVPYRFPITIPLENINTNQFEDSTPQKRAPFYLSDEKKEDYMNICIPLYNAALRGDWPAAQTIIDHPDMLKTSITKTEDTVLHVVSTTTHTQFAEKLVDKMDVKDLGLVNQNGETALWIAVGSCLKMVEVLLKKNNDLLKIRTKGDLPFLCAVWYGDKDVVEYLYAKTNLADENWNESDLKRILSSCLAFDLLDIVLKILKQYKEEGWNLTIDGTVLKNLAEKPSAFNETVQPVIRRLINSIFLGQRLEPNENSKAVEIVRIMWGEIVKQKHEDIKTQIASCEGLLFTAAKLGNYKFIIELIRLYPDITWDNDENEHTIFHIAVLHRQEDVYNLLYEFGSKKLGTNDGNGNNILHLAAKKPPQSRLNIVSGAALQMQRELLWFEEVKSIVSSVERTWKNTNNESPQEIFTREHTELMAEGERWLKETAAQCMVVAALIATIMFAAAFTLPGGNNQDSGNPLFMKRSAFQVFVVTDAISLCTSSTSILMFLAMLTSRYTENDFMVSLPMKLMFGLLTLFISIATMMIAFSASFFLIYSESMKWIPVIVTVSAGLPVILFARLQYRLLLDVVNSKFNSRHLFKPKKRMLY